MRPVQVHLFADDNRIPQHLPDEPVFFYENKRYLNFASFDCLHLRNHDYLKEAAKLAIDQHGLTIGTGPGKAEAALVQAMNAFKKTEDLLLFPDEISAVFYVLSIFGEKTTFFVEYETSPAIAAVVPSRSVEFYRRDDPEQLRKLISARSERVLFVDGIYEWSGSISPMNDLIAVAREFGCFVVANEISSFGFLGRDGRGLIDFFNLYDDVNLEVGGFQRFLGGFGAYVAGKKYLLRKIEDNITGHEVALPEFMNAVNRAGLDFLQDEKVNKRMIQGLWSQSRYAITRLRQDGFNTPSDTPIIVVCLGNEEEARSLARRLFDDGLIVGQKRERIRLILSIEHTKEDIDFCLDRLLVDARQLGIK